jgi:hypothetical protein
MKTKIPSASLKRFSISIASAITVAVLGLAVPRASACGDYAESGILIQLADQAVSPDEALASRARVKLREFGPRGLKALLDRHGAMLAQHRSAMPLTNSATTGAWSRLSRALDSVGQQRDCASSRLFWHTDFEQAKASAKASGKPILSLRLLGRLDEELSCANSRFFRTALYANAQVSGYLRDHFILHWQSVRPVPRVTIDFGDGRKLERTVTGNSIHYVLDAEGNPVDGLPGLYGPKAFLEALTRAERAAKDYSALAPSDRAAYLQSHHRSRLAAVLAEWNRDLSLIGDGPRPVSVATQPGAASVPPTAMEAARQARGKRMVEAVVLQNIVPRPSVDGASLERQTDDQTWMKLAALHAEKARLDPDSLALMRRKHPDAVAAGRLSVSKVAVEDPLVRAARQFERSMAEDTVRNEYLFHTRIHQWFAEADARTLHVGSLNERVYAELFLTPSSDPWLGLKPEGVYSAIEQEGIRSFR